ncbi:MAG TPA: hypothetical protein ENJ87_02275 [Gammaproteobacteria bacterium]|nr:hypothetical protein [Gammaproteobacteria bacterium]
MKKTVVVIGAGLAGSLVCNESVKEANVVLLELGDKDKVSYPRINFIKKKLAEVKTFCFGGGGTTNLWHNGLIPINTKDVSSEYFSELLDEVKPYADKAASRLFFPNQSYTSEYENVVSDMSRESEKLGVFKEGIDCLLYPKKFQRLEVDAAVDSYYSVENIEFESEGKSIAAVTFRSGYEQHRINADAVIISAGTFGTPRLIGKVLSVLGVSSKDVGRGLIDHPLGFVGKVKIKKHLARTMHKFAMHDKGDYEYCTAARYKSQCGRYTCFAFFRPALTMTNRLSIYKYKSLLGASSGFERIKNAFSFKIFHPDIIAEIFSHLFGVTIRSRIFNVLFYFEQKRGSGQVSYDGEVLNIDWSITEEEMKVYNDMLEQVSVSMMSVSDEVNIQLPITEQWLWSGAHHSGTISLGGTADELLDKDLKLRACDNVYVCDGSVIQENSYANTGLTIGQLALRLAERVSRP